MLDTIGKLDAAMRLIKVVTGEPHGDGNTVTDLGIGYAEPGYGGDEKVWVTGDWNDKSQFHELPGGGGKWVKTDTTPSRLFKALERIGVEGEWLDEWQRCSHCYRLVRTSPDSYSWKRFYVDLQDGDSLCGNCAIDPDFVEDWLPDFVNDPHRVLTFVDKAWLESQGWSLYNQEHQFENGWHPGQNDRPDQILETIQNSAPNMDVLFWMDEASQFYVGFSAFVKEKVVEDDES